MIRSEQRAVAKFQQNSDYQAGGFSAQLKDSSASFSSVVSGVDASTGKIKITGLDGGTGQGQSISGRALVPGNVVTQSIKTAMGGILNQ